MNLKGIAGPARAWAALRASSVESRFDATSLTAVPAENLIRRGMSARMGYDAR
jgi:hypothetical protein